MPDKKLLEQFSKANRRSPTTAEKVFWRYLRDRRLRRYKFRRQHVIGDYIVDFVCLDKMLIVELDGEYHDDDEQAVRDAERTRRLEGMGFSVLRLDNRRALRETEWALMQVIQALEDR